MIKLKEVLQRVKSLYSQGVESDDLRLTDRHIYSKVKSVRSFLINQKINKKQKISDWNYQTIKCIEIIESSLHECNCIINNDCHIYRTKEKIPRILNNYNEHLIRSVYSLNNNIKFDYLNLNSVRYINGNKYTKNKPYYFIQDGYFYFISNNVPKVISITALFEDPIEIEVFKELCECQECKCIDPLEMNFYIDSEMLDVLVELCLNELIVIFKSNSQDISNNTKDDSHIRMELLNNKNKEKDEK